MRLTYADLLQCDACGAKGLVEHPRDAVVLRSPRPPGWLIDEVTLRVGQRIMLPDVCASCASRPFADVLTAVRDRQPPTDTFCNQADRG